MPIYNGIEFIDESVPSILNQTYTNWNLIIGINGHPPDSNVYNIAKKYIIKDSTQVQVLDLFKIKGKSAALNEMIKSVSIDSDYIALLDVDDIWHPLKLEKQSAYLNLQEYDVVGSKCIYIGDLNGIVPNIPTGDISTFDFFKMNPIINSSSIIRKSLCRWDSNCDVEDYDLWLTLYRSGAKFFNCSEILVKHHIHTSSHFNSNGKNNLQVPQLLQKHRL